MKLSLLLTVLLFSIGSAQNNLEDVINFAFENAKKGVYWSLENIPEKKNSLEADLINDDILYATIKITKEVEGVKIQSKGFYASNEVSIIIYRSLKSLVSEGYIKPPASETHKNDK